METKLDPTEIARWKRIAQQDADYHSRQFSNRYRSTAALGEFVKPLIGSTSGEALDVACGAGANIYHLSQMLPGFHWSGVDIAGEELFPIGDQFFQASGMNVDLKPGDFYRLDDYFGGKKFDISFAIQTFSSLDTYDRLLDQLFSVTTGWIFANVMCSEFDVDVKIEVNDYTWPEDCPNPGNYNVYSLPRFRRICEARGCKEVISREFVMDLDMSPPESGGLGTYTRKLEGGQRIQFSGPIFLPWTFVGVRIN